MQGTPEEITATVRRLLDYYDNDIGIAVTALVCGGERRASMRRHPSAACPPPYDQDAPATFTASPLPPPDRTTAARIATVLDFRARKPDVSSHLEGD
jgi:hypothetical protein